MGGIAKSLSLAQTNITSPDPLTDTGKRWHGCSHDMGSGQVRRVLRAQERVAGWGRRLGRGRGGSRTPVALEGLVQQTFASTAAGPGGTSSAVLNRASSRHFRPHSVAMMKGHLDTLHLTDAIICGVSTSGIAFRAEQVATTEQGFSGCLEEKFDSISLRRCIKLS